MQLNLLGLSRDVLNKILSCVENGSLLQLREVSKPMKEIADVLVVTKQTVIKFLNVSEGYTDDKIFVDILFDDRRDCMLWKIGVISTFTHLGIPKLDESFSRWKEHAFDYILTARELKEFLAHLKPLVIRTTFCQLPSWISFRDLRPGTIATCAIFFDGYEVPSVEILPRDPENIEVTQWLNLMRRCNIVKVFLCRIQHTPATFRFLLQLSDIAREISIRMDVADEDRQIPLPNSLCQTILSRRCDSLYISRPKSAYSLAHLERMIQFLHHTGRKKKFDSWVNINIQKHMKITIGEYLLTVRQSNKRSEFVLSHSGLKEAEILD